MSCLLLLLLFLLSISKIEQTVEISWPASSSGVKLIGLFPREPENTSKTDSWIAQCSAMFRAAIILSQQFNITFQEKYLGYEEIKTDNDIMVTVDHTCEKVSASSIVGFIGPAYSSEARYIASFANRLGIISVSYAATSPDLSTIDTGAFYRVVPSDESTILGITKLFEQYKWKSCIVIYQNDEYGYYGMKLLSEKFSETGIKTREKIKFDMNKQNFQIDFQKTLINSFSRIVIVWSNEVSTITILKKALEQNMIGPDFVWILSVTVALNHFSPIQKQGLVGLLTIELVQGDSVDAPINTELLNEAYKIWKNYDPETFPGVNKVDSYALFTFDSTWSLILALQQLCSMNLSCLEFMNVSNCYNRQFLYSKPYYNIMKTTSFLGVSGEIKFTNGSIDRISNVYYMIKNIQTFSAQENNIDYVPVLNWHIRASEWTYVKNRSDVIVWPNLSKNRPLDHKLIKGQELRMAIIESPPFIILKNSTAAYSGMKGNYTEIEITEFDGFFKDVLVYLKDRMHFIPVIMLVKPTTQYEELVEGVANDLFDTVMSTIAISERRRRIADFSAVIIPHSIRIIIRKPTSDALDIWFFVKPFSWELWAFILAITLLTGLSIWLFERKHHENPLSVIAVMSFPFHVVIDRNNHFSPKSSAGRFLTFGLYVLQVILFTVYAASIFQYLTIQRSDPIISGIDDLKNGKIPPIRIGTVVGSQVELYYLNTISQGKKNYYPLKSVNEVYERLMTNDIDVGLWTNGSTAYHLNNKYCDLMTVGDDFGQNYYALPVKQDWLYKPDLDSDIVLLVESGEMERLSSKWFSPRNCTNDEQSSKTATVTVKALRVLLIAFAIFLILSIILHIIIWWLAPLPHILQIS